MLETLPAVDGIFAETSSNVAEFVTSTKQRIWRIIVTGDNELFQELVK